MLSSDGSPRSMVGKHGHESGRTAIEEEELLRGALETAGMAEIGRLEEAAVENMSVTDLKAKAAEVRGCGVRVFSISSLPCLASLAEVQMPSSHHGTGWVPLLAGCSSPVELDFPCTPLVDIGFSASSSSYLHLREQ